MVCEICTPSVTLINYVLFNSDQLYIMIDGQLIYTKASQANVLSDEFGYGEYCLCRDMHNAHGRDICSFIFLKVYFFKISY